VVRLARKLFHTSDAYDGDKLFTVVGGRRVMTPMLLVMVAIGGTDVLFALDSVPAIFGLTENVYLVFTATAFSLLGLRQLYFLIDGLLDRLIYLTFGLAAILGFIGVKLILHALHENNVPIINDGRPVPVVEISTGLSLAVIIGTLVVTVVASLASAKGKAQNVVTAARHHALDYLDVETDPARREEIFAKLAAEIETIKAMPEKFKARIRQEEKLMALFVAAHEKHRQATTDGSAGSPERPRDQ
jgi:tellurite resistance protein TerC